MSNYDNSYHHKLTSVSFKATYIVNCLNNTISPISVEELDQFYDDLLKYDPDGYFSGQLDKYPLELYIDFLHYKCNSDFNILELINYLTSIWQSKSDSKVQNQEMVIKFENPFEGYVKLMEMQNNIPTELKELPAPVHHTLIVVEGSRNSPESFKERVTRTIGIFNNEDTTKAVIITVADGKIFFGLNLTGDSSGGREIDARGTQYTQVIRISDSDVS